MSEDVTGKVWPKGHTNLAVNSSDEPERILEAEGGLAGVRPPKGTPLPNRADAAYAELAALRAEAERLGLPADPTEPLADLRARVEAARDR